jgi:hypothetical protein
MASLWPWALVAAAGALHGLNPCTGWALATACGVRSGDLRDALRALVPIAAGHAASVAAVAALVALGTSSDTTPLQWLSGAVLLAVVLHRAGQRGVPRRRPQSGRVGLALWSFTVATVHGTGLMLVPALIPLCLGDSPAREITASGSLLLALAAVGLHTAVMLSVTGVVACGACGVIDALRRRRCASQADDTPRASARAAR